MVQLADLELPDNPRLAQNILHFVRALRRAGLPVGPGRVVDAVRAVSAAGFTQKEDFFWTLQSVLVSRPEHRAVFAQIFRLYWRDPRFMEHMMAMLTPLVRGVQEERGAKAAEKRAAEALLDGQGPEPPEDRSTPGEDEVELTIDAAQTASGDERLRSLDFEQMSVAEAARARRILAEMTLPVPPILTRRYASGAGRSVDMRRTLARAARQGGDIRTLARKARKERLPALVVLCDISGSMSQYSRAVLHFVHGVANAQGQGWAAVHAFTFGTRLTNITRHMARRDVDAALQLAGAEAQDWDGGTRIGACLTTFNREWSRRVLGQGAVVILLTDGLERGDPELLGLATERLGLSCRQLIWVNPLLRFEAFAPKAAGVRAMLPHVSSLRTGHNIAALEGLSAALSQPFDAGEKARLMAAIAPDERAPEQPYRPDGRGIGARLAALAQPGGSATS